MDKKLAGILFVLAAAFAWAVDTVFSKLAFADSAPVVQTVFFRGVIVFLVAALYIVFSSKASFRIEKRQIAPIVYVAVLGTLVADTLFYIGLFHVPVVNANLIAHLQPVFIVLFSFFVYRQEKVSRSDYLGIFLMLFAALLVTTRTFENLLSLRFGSFYDFVVLVSTVIWATTSIVVKKYLQGINVGVLVFYRFLFASFALFLFLFFTGGIFLSSIFQILVGLVVGTGYIFYYEGLMRLKAAETGALELVSPFFAAFLGVLFLGELITFLQMAGMLLLFAGIYFLSKRE